MEFDTTWKNDYPDAPELSKEQYEFIKKKAWVIACQDLKAEYNTPTTGQYTPFMTERERRLQAIRSNITFT